MSFLRSPVGRGTTTGGTTFLLGLAGMGFALRLRRSRVFSLADSDGRDLLQALGGRLALANIAAGLLLAGVALVPLTFSLGFRDAFAAPKLMVLSIVGLASSAMLAPYLRLGHRGPHLTRSQRIALGLVIGYGIWNVFAFLAAGPNRQGFFGERYQLQGLWATSLYAVSWWLGFRLVRGTRRFALLARAIAGAMVGVGLYALIQLFGGDFVWGGLRELRAFSSIGQPNALAAFLVLGLPIVASEALTTPDMRARILALAATAVGTVALIASGSRAGFLAMAVAGVIWLLLVRPDRLSLRDVGRWVAVSGIALVVAALIIPSFRQVTANSASRSIAGLSVLGDESARQHLDLWVVGTAMAADHLIRGIGPERFPLEFPRYRDSVLEPERRGVYLPFRVESPHNVYIGIAVAAGLPALAAYLGLLIAGFVGLAQLRRVRGPLSRGGVLAAGGLAALAAHAVTDFFMTPEFSSAWPAWILLGAASAGLRSWDEARASSRD